MWPVPRESNVAKFLLLTKYGTDGVAPIAEWSPQDIRAHMDYLQALNKELAERGELIGVQALAGPELTKIVVADGETAPVVSDGPFPEFKEWLAGFQVIEVADEARALEIAALVSAVPGKDGVPTQQPIHVRQVMSSSGQDM